MEESAKRKERLKAMRVEADQAQASPNLTTPSNLSNPFAESINPMQESPSIPARFDFYTDPMAAFSGHKRKMASSYHKSPTEFASAINHASPMPQPPPSLPGPETLETTPSPCNQFQKSYSPGQQMYEAPQPYHASRPWGSPVGHQVAPPGASSGAYSGYQQTPPGPWNRPFLSHQGTPPGVWNVSGGRPGHAYPSNSPRGSGFPSTGHGPGPGWGGSPSTNSGRGNGGQYNNHPNPGGRTWSGNPSMNLRRGRGGQHNSPNPRFHRGGSPSSNSGRGSFGRGGGRGRGQGSDCCISARDRPDLFYDKSMVEDPWSRLTPVVRTVEKNWLPKSIRMKRDQPKDQPSEATRFLSSGLSLAESLAASFEEVASDVNNL